MLSILSLYTIITSDKPILGRIMKQHQVTADILEKIMNQVIKANRESPSLGTEIFKEAIRKVELIRSGALNEPAD